MDTLLSPAAAGYADAIPAPALPPLRVEFSTLPATSALAEPDVLAVVGFGAVEPVRGDPRLARVALEAAWDSAPLEIWRGRGPVVCGSQGDMAWSSDGDYSFATLDLDERDFGGIAPAAQHAYAQLSAWRAACATPHLLRLWNYVDAINLGDGDAERYRQFCSGRAAGMDAAMTSSYPAASAVGVRDGRRRLQVCALAASQPGISVENPRQVSAWRYPRQYGPVAPGFARAMRAASLSPQLYISGTAAVVGHASHHAGDLAAQIDETLANLVSLLGAAGAAPLGATRSVLKAYVRHAADAELVRDRLHARIGADTPLLVLLGDICRAELLVEVEGLHAG